MRPMNSLLGFIGGSTLEEMLIARHRVIDDKLTKAIEAGEVTQVLEVAAGLSPRGYRFTKLFPDLKYIEADLPEMAAHKRSVLEAADSLGPRHPVIEIDALADDGENSIGAVCARTLDPKSGAVIITEGLLSYFEVEQIRGIWSRFAAALSPLPFGLYLSDLHLDEDIGRIRGARVFRRALNQWTRGGHHTYFADADSVTDELTRAGFAEATVPYASDFASELDLSPRERTGRVRIVVAHA